MIKILLPFRTAQCEKCQATRQATQPCPECGRKAKRHEVDSRLLQRKRLIAEFRQLRAPGVRQEPNPDLIAEQTTSAIDLALRGMRDVARHGGDSCRLIQAFEAIDSLVASWPPEALPRPSRNEGYRVSHILTRAQSALELYLDALSADTMQGAQELAKEAQKLLDGAAGDTSHEGGLDWQALAERALGDSQGSIADFATLDQRLAINLGTGNAKSYPAGSGLQLLIMDALVDELFDRENVVAVRDAFAETLASLKVGSELFGLPAWRHEARRVGRIFASNWRALAKALDEEEPDDMDAVNALLGVVEASRETMLRFTLTTLMTLSSTDQWQKWQSKSVGGVITAANRTFPNLGLDQIDSALRHVAAHKSFDVHEELVFARLDDGTVEAYEYAAFIDRCLHAIEVVAAIQYAIFVWVAECGYEWPSSELQRRQDREDGLVFLLRLSGLHVSDIQWCEDSLYVDVEGVTDSWVLLVAAMVNLLPESISWLKIGAHAEDENVTIEANVATVRNIIKKGNECTSDEDQLGIIAALQGITVNGISQVPEEYWEGLLFNAAKWRKNDSVAAQTKRLLAWRPLIEACDSPSARSLYIQTLRAAREGNLMENSVPTDSSVSFLRLRREPVAELTSVGT